MTSFHEKQLVSHLPTRHSCFPPSFLSCFLYDRPHDHARTLGERDGNDEGDKDDNNEYGENGNIPDDDDEYAGGRQTTKKYTTTDQKHAGSTGEI